MRIWSCCRHVVVFVYSDYLCMGEAVVPSDLGTILVLICRTSDVQVDSMPNHVQGYLHYSYVCTFVSGDGKQLTFRTEKDKQT